MTTRSDLDQKHILAGKRIIVAGAGIAGLAFARALDLAWPTSQLRPEVVLYEQSAEVQDVSRDGYTMGIRRESGLRALADLGLLETALKNSTTSARPTIWAKDWTTLLQIGAPKGNGTQPPSMIRLVRHVLREILVAAVPETATINWSRGCKAARSLTSGRIEVTLHDGSTDICDLLIAADGANSKIRMSLLPDATLQYAGAVCYIATSRFPSGKPEVLKEKWGINISGVGIPFLTFPVDSTSGVWAMSRRSEKPVRRIRGAEAIDRKDEILHEVKQLGKTFAEPFGSFINATDPTTLQVFNTMHRYPIIHAKDLPGANVIFIGDANHAMSPYSGNGANMALLDAVELARRLAGHPTSIRTAIDDFDKEAAPRSRKAIDGSWWMIRILHSSGWVFWALRAVLAVANIFLGLKK